MELLTFLSTLLVLFAASVTDLRTREVPDLLSYGFIIFAVSLGSSRAWIAGNPALLGAMLLGAAATAALGALLFFAGQWGGADAKLLIGIGALLGLWLAEYRILLFLILLLLVGALYGVAYTILLALRNRKQFLKGFSRARARRQ